MSNGCLLLILPAGMLLTFISARNPQFIENNYAEGIYRVFASPLSTVTGFLPFSLGELLIVFFIAAMLYRFSLEIKRWLGQESGLGQSLARIAMISLAVASLLYGGFVLSWGLNYYRLPFAETAHFQVQPAPVAVLADVCRGMIHRANQLRASVGEDGGQVMKIAGNKNVIFIQASAGYKKIAVDYPELGGSFGPPKGVFFSRAMSYAGITGVYFPFTGEANVNTMVPTATLPFTVCHEMAHQRGFAREDEANFIAYLACQANPDFDFQYSGTLMAVIYLMNTLEQYDPSVYSQLQAHYGGGVARDLTAINVFWRQFQGPVEKVSTQVNDLFLKSNGQEDGVYSYNRMVDLLIAEYRKNG